MFLSAVFGKLIPRHFTQRAGAFSRRKVTLRPIWADKTSKEIPFSQAQGIVTQDKFCLRMSFWRPLPKQVLENVLVWSKRII